jgi:hypothetical protein
MCPPQNGVAAHTGLEDPNSSTNVGIDSEAAGQRMILPNIGENPALLNNGSNGDSVPATMPDPYQTPPLLIQGSGWRLVQGKDDREQVTEYRVWFLDILGTYG